MSSDSRRALCLFIGLTLLLSWSGWIYIAAHALIIAPGKGDPTHFPGLMGPALAALMTCGFSRDRKGAWADMAGRLFDVRRAGFGVWMMALSPLWLFALLSLSAPYSGLSVHTERLGSYSGLPVMSPLQVFGWVFFVNAVGEEVGWRGFLLPRLQKRFGVTGGTGLSALIWGAWHAPLFFCLQTYLGMTPVVLVFGFGLGLLSGAVWLAWLTARAKGLLLPAILWHALYNLFTATQAADGYDAIATTLVMTVGLGLLIAAPFSARVRRALTLPTRVSVPGQGQGQTRNPVEFGP